MGLLAFVGYRGPAFADIVGLGWPELAVVGLLAFDGYRGLAFADVVGLGWLGLARVDCRGPGLADIGLLGLVW